MPWGMGIFEPSARGHLSANELIQIDWIRINGYDLYPADWFADIATILRCDLQTIGVAQHNMKTCQQAAGWVAFFNPLQLAAKWTVLREASKRRLRQGQPDDQN